jgi:hypothetical protein
MKINNAAGVTKNHPHLLYFLNDEALFFNSPPPILVFAGY